jgi:tRNA(fMet)-specific endonuclease VapC
VTYLLDTDIFSLAHQKKFGLRERIAAVRPPDVVAVSTVNRIEVLVGRFEAVMKAATADDLIRLLSLLASSEAYLATFPLVPLDRPAADLFGRRRADKWAKRMGRGDLLLACLSLAHRATLVSRNTKDFAGVPGLRVENWAD